MAYIVGHPNLLDSFELIEFCFNKNILEEEVKKHHFELKLSLLASTKNYLQLNKLSPKTLNTLLLDFSEIHGDKADQTINTIMENYLGRTEIRANDYFMQPGMEPLLHIWEKYHHSITYMIAAQDKIRQSQFLESQSMKTSLVDTGNYGQYSVHTLNSCPNIYTTGTTQFMGASTMKQNYQTNAVFSSELEESERKIAELEAELALKKEIIQKLKEEIMNAKAERSKSTCLIESD